MRKKSILVIAVSVLVLAAMILILTSFHTTAARYLTSQRQQSVDTTEDDYVFIHHSCGSNWLSSGLRDALSAKEYVDEVNDVTYGTTMLPDAGRPASLGSVPGDLTDMNHWIYWFNDYLDNLTVHQTEDGFNRIIMFKSCFPNSYIPSDGSLPAVPWGPKTVINYKGVFQHPDGAGSAYLNTNGYEYKALEDIFAENPEILFVPITAPPMSYFSGTPQPDDIARARLFNNWLVDEWLPAYHARNPGLNNVAVFDWFDFLAYPDNHPDYPNFLRQEYGGDQADSHPNTYANQESTKVFATNPVNFLDNAWDMYTNTQPDLSPSYKQPSEIFVSDGTVVTYTVHIQNADGPMTHTVRMEDTITVGLEYINNSLTATSGVVTDTHSPLLQWGGLLDSSGDVTVTYRVTVNSVAGSNLSNTAWIYVGDYVPTARSAIVLVRDEIWQLFHPLIPKIP